MRLIYAFDMHVAGKLFSVSLACVEFEETSTATELTYTEQAFYLDGEYGTESRMEGTNGLLDQFASYLETLRRKGPRRMTSALRRRAFSGSCPQRTVRLLIACGLQSRSLPTTIFPFVIGVMMSNEDVPQRIQRDTRKDELTGNAIATIDNIRNAVRYDDLS